MSNPEDDEYLPHEWPEQHCGKCGKPVGGETLFARGQFFHSVCLGRKIDPPTAEELAAIPDDLF